MVAKSAKCIACGFRLEPGWRYCPNYGLVAPKKGKQLALWIEVKLRQKRSICWNCGKVFNKRQAAADFKKNGEFFCTKCGARQDISIATVWLLQEKGKSLPENVKALMTRKS